MNVISYTALFNTVFSFTVDSHSQEDPRLTVPHTFVQVQLWIFCGSTYNIIQSKPSCWRCDGCKHARAATRKTTLHGTSFTIAGSSRLQLHALFVLSKFVYIFCQGHTLPLDCLSCSSLTIHLMYPWFEPLARIPNKFLVCTGDIKRKIAPIGAPWSLFQKQSEALFMHAYHWTQTKEA